MTFDYANSGDILYGVENYQFRYNGYDAVDIKLLNMIDDNAYMFDVEIKDSIKLSQYKLRKFSTINHDIRELLNVEINAPIRDREEALQMAINWTSYVLEEYSDISTKIQNYNLRK